MIESISAWQSDPPMVVQVVLISSVSTSASRFREIEGQAGAKRGESCCIFGNLPRSSAQIVYTPAQNMIGFSSNTVFGSAAAEAGFFVHQVDALASYPPLGPKTYCNGGQIRKSEMGGPSDSASRVGAMQTILYLY